MVESPNVPTPVSDSIATPGAESQMDSTPVVAGGDPMDVFSVRPPR